MFDVKCKVIEIPTSNLEVDFIRLAKTIGCKKKTHFECCFPFLYVYPEIKETEVLSGWALMVIMVLVKRLFYIIQKENLNLNLMSLEIFTFQKTIELVIYGTIELLN
jgi:hypothetical protein